MPRADPNASRTLLVDTGFSASPLVRSLHQRGHRVTAVGSTSDDALARLGVERWDVDYGAPGAAEELHHRGGFDHVVPGCNDVSLLAAAEIAALAGLPCHDSPDVTVRLLDKAAFRTICAEVGLPAPAVLSTETAVGRDVVVKPRRAFSGRGVTVLEHASRRDLDDSAAAARRACAEGGHVLEAFVPGQLHSHSAFVTGGRVVSDVWVVEHQTRSDLAVDVSHVVPPPRAAGAVRAEVEALVAALGLADGPVHSQLLLDGERHAFVEVTRRCPGDLYAELVRRATGLDHADAYVSSYVGSAPGDGGTAIPTNHVLRLTVAPTAAMSLGTFRLLRPVVGLEVVPLRRRGDRLAAGAAGRAAVAFVEARDADELEELVGVALRRELLQIVPDADAGSW